MHPGIDEQEENTTDCPVITECMEDDCIMCHCDQEGMSWIYS